MVCEQNPEEQTMLMTPTSFAHPQRPLPLQLPQLWQCTDQATLKMPTETSGTKN